MPNQTPSPEVTMTMALVGPNSAALTPADRAAIQAAMAQAIPGISARPTYSSFLCCDIQLSSSMHEEWSAKPEPKGHRACSAFAASCSPCK